MINSIILGNGDISGYEISIDGGKPKFRYCNVPKKIKGKGNIEAEPYFKDAENGDFRLMSVACGDPFDSPCIDAGDPSISDIKMDCNAGLGTGRGDMGAFGGDRLGIIDAHVISSENPPVTGSEKGRDLSE